MIRAFLFFIVCPFSLVVSADELIIYTESSPPYQYVGEDNQVVGSATERVRSIVERAGYTAQFRLYPWARAVYLVDKSSRALIFSIAKTPRREALYQWIAPVAEFRLALVALANHAPFELDSWDQLTRYSVSAQREDVSYAWLTSQGMAEGKQLYICPDIQCSWEQLMLGTVDFIIEDPSLIDDTARQFGTDPAKLQVVKPIPDLDVMGYLAANERMPIEIVVRLRRAAKEIEAEATSGAALVKQ